ncbi:MAG TPA: hypothetical protein VK669_14130 [Candidatus Limnocylindrales bacterium]|nr:hypothetical protein [Candidatus Limnocylindrales bacterium]
MIDYRHLYALVRDCCDREEDRGKALDAKLTTLIAGVTALIGFALHSALSPWSSVAAVFGIVPLGCLFGALMVKRGRLAPTPESLATFYPEYPVRTLRESVTAMTRTWRTNAELNEMRAARLDVSVVLTAIVAVGFLIAQSAAMVH